MKRSMEMAQGVPLDITGMKFGHLTALYDTGERKNRKQIWMCTCDICGSQNSFRKSSLVSGDKTDCGCLNKYLKEDLTGQRFGKLTVIEIQPDKKNSRDWLCQCDCGKLISTSQTTLRNGSKKSCGCAFREYNAEKKNVRERELVGKVFGTVTVLGITDQRKNRQIVWRCRCTCGSELFLTSNALDKKKKASSCHCSGNPSSISRKKDITGYVFGRLTVVGPTDKKDKSGFLIWKCRCSCDGKTIEVSKQSLRLTPEKGKRSCGCLQKERGLQAKARAKRED